MTFKQAYKKLKVIADGRYFSIRYELTTHTNESMEQVCVVYVDPSLRGDGKTWDEAFEELDHEMNGRPPMKININNIPEIATKEAP